MILFIFTVYSSLNHFLSLYLDVRNLRLGKKKAASNVRCTPLLHIMQKIYYLLKKYMFLVLINRRAYIAKFNVFKLLARHDFYPDFFF